MSYVIQNFSPLTRHFIFTPKIKSLVLLINLEKIFLFFKLNSHFFYSSNRGSVRLDYFFLFYNYFYPRQSFLVVYKFNSQILSFYENNLHKSFRYHFFKSFLSNLTKPYKNYDTRLLEPTDILFFNQYFTSIKTINYKLPKTYYKNLFFFFMLNFSFLWQQHSSFFKFYLNFVFVNNHLNLAPFFNGYFLHVYNF